MHFHHCFLRIIMVAMDQYAFAKHDALEERRKELGVRVPCLLGQNAVGCRELCEYWVLGIHTEQIIQHKALEETRLSHGACRKVVANWVRASYSDKSSSVEPILSRDEIMKAVVSTVPGEIRTLAMVDQIDNEESAVENFLARPFMARLVKVL
ncbi:hypothetical protein SUGI_0493290 [Cryptomeria japonica]|nr:hypothetical protein SUGI_0493290 [Cryptomeria japonica]